VGREEGRDDAVGLSVAAPATAAGARAPPLLPAAGTNANPAIIGGQAWGGAWRGGWTVRAVAAVRVTVGVQPEGWEGGELGCR